MSFEVTEDDLKNPFFALGRIQEICEASPIYDVSDSDKLYLVLKAIKECMDRNPKENS